VRLLQALSHVAVGKDDPPEFFNPAGVIDLRFL